MLMYGNTWFGVLEANYSLAFAQFLTAAMGTGVWDTQVMTLPEQIPLPDMIPRTWSECAAVIAGHSPLMGWCMSADPCCCRATLFVTCRPGCAWL